MSNRTAQEPAPLAIPPAECQAEAPARDAFRPPLLPPAPTQVADPLAGTADRRLLELASRDELIASREHWRQRAPRSEVLASAALEYIEQDRTEDADLDDVWNRCAAEDRRDAEAQAAWAARNQRREE